MLFNIIQINNIINIQHPITIDIQPLEKMINKLQPKRTKWSPQHHNEFIIINTSIVIFIKVVEQLFYFLFIQTHLVVMHCFQKFFVVQPLVVIVIHYFKLSCHSQDRTVVSTVQSFTKFFQNLISFLFGLDIMDNTFIILLTSRRIEPKSLLLEYNSSKFIIIQLPRPINIIICK